MNALLRKEVRLLLPSFAAALLLSFSIWLLPSALGAASKSKALFTILSFVACPALVVMMALDSFGKEISGGTFPLLLAQPVARTRLWRIKTGLLGAATVIVLLSWVLSFHFHSFDSMARNMARNDPTAWKWTFHATAVLFALVTFSGGLWTVLFFRQVTAAFWFTLIVPGAIVIGFTNLIERHPDTWRNAMMAALVLYSVAGFLWARRLFLRAQDVQPTGGAIAMPGWLKFGRQSPDAIEVERPAHSLVASPADSEARRCWRPRAALWQKELQLHQSHFVLAGVLLLLHFVVIASRRFVKESDSPALHFVLLTFWVLWLFMPLLVGCTAVAEERKLGTLEGQLCLPATRRRQFAIKLVTALLLSMLFGAVLPLLLEQTRILPNFDRQLDGVHITEKGGAYFPLGEILSPILPFLALAGIAAAIGLMAFYASSLSRNTLQSLAPGVLGVLLAFLVANMAAHRENLPGFPWPLVYVLAAPAFAFALVGLMYWNFKRVLVGGAVWWRNALVLVLTLFAVTVATATLYHRPWELLTGVEPPHGPPVAALDERTTMRLEGWRPLVQLPDGRVWAAHMGRWDEEGGLIGNFGGAFLDGTNWLKVVSTQRDIVGLKTDGSLWVTEESEKWTYPQPTATRQSNRMIRVGMDNDWTNAVAYQNLSMLLLKTDGKLWEIGAQKWTTNQSQLGLRGYTPQRLGTETNWTALSVLNNRIFLGQRDGGFWVWPKYSATDTNTFTLRPGLTLYRAPELHPTDPPSLWVPWAQIGVLSDGTLRVTGEPRGSGKKSRPPSIYAPLGKERDWRALAGKHQQTPITLKADGTIWKWKFLGDPITNPGSAVATKFSTHSDWVAISEGWNGVLALARDGSLWLWRLENPHEHPSQRTLLRASRRPQRLGNIFETAER